MCFTLALLQYFISIFTVQVDSTESYMQNLTVEQAIEVKKLFVGGVHLNFNLPHSEIFSL